jgi:hypothetical protein
MKMRFGNGLGGLSVSFYPGRLRVFTILRGCDFFAISKASSSRRSVNEAAFSPAAESEGGISCFFPWPCRILTWPKDSPFVILTAA